MKVYLQGNFCFLSQILPCTCVTFKNINEVPDDCDLVAYSNFDNQCIDETIEALCAKSSWVFFDWNEFVWPDFPAQEIALHEQHPNLQIFSAAVPNYQSRLLFSGFWFITAQNYYSASNATFWARKALQSIDSPQHRDHTIDCLLGRRTDNRDYLESCYLELSATQRKKIKWSYWKDDITQGIWDIDISNIRLSSESVLLRDPCTDEIDQPCASAILPVDIYNRSWFSVVAETVSYADFSFFTEKVAKPLLAGRVFVCFAGQHYVKNLRKLGFRTFHNIIDEAYDDLEDPMQRWEAAWQQIKHLLESDPVQIYQQALEIVTHNQTHFRQHDWLGTIKHHAMNLISDHRSV
jgi:hypothetical protein